MLLRAKKQSASPEAAPRKIPLSSWGYRDLGKRSRKGNFPTSTATGKKKLSREKGSAPKKEKLEGAHISLKREDTMWARLLRQTCGQGAEIRDLQN